MPNFYRDVICKDRRRMLAAGPMLMAGQCSYSQLTGGINAASALLPVITTDLTAACASSQTLVGQAATYSDLTSVANKVNAEAAKVCGKIAPTSSKVATALNALNTITATLLGAAGAIGIKLPGLTAT